MGYAVEWAMVRLLVAASLAAVLGCAAAGSVAAGPFRAGSAAQALRACVDRWNQGNMLDWGPTLANVAIRRDTADQLAAVGLRDPKRPRCTVSLAVHSRRDPGTGCTGEAVLPGHPGFCVYRQSTYVCIINRFGGYGCPTNAEGSPPLRHKNATTDKRGVLTLDVPLAGTRPTPPLAWQLHYPHTNGWIEPWTSSGRLRAGLRLRGHARGSCSRGSYETPAKAAGRCVPLDGSGIYDPCFARRGGWGRRGTVLACATWPGATTFSRFVIATDAPRSSDPPLFVPWRRIGDVALGEPKALVERRYGSVGHGYHVIQRYGNTVQGYYRLHGSRVIVTFYGRRVGELEFSTGYYRTKSGFGVGSRIPLGPCHRTATNPCEHRWHGFVYNARLRESPCNCWVKVGRGRRSLPVTGTNFLKPWFFIYLRHGRIARFYFALRYVD